MPSEPQPPKWQCDKPHAPNATTNQPTPVILSDEALAEIEARASAASKGDWTIRGGSWLDGGVRLAGYGIRFADGPLDGYEGWDARTNFPPETPEGKQASADRTFLAHARTDIPALCQTVRAAWSEINEKLIQFAALREQLAHRTVELENESREMQKWNNRANQLTIEGQELRQQLAQVEKERDDLRDSVKTRPSHWEPDPRHWQPVPDNEQVTVDTNCEACDAGYRLAKDGLHYNDEHGGRTWGVCRKVVASLDKEQP